MSDHHDKSAVALSSVFASAGMAAMKLVVGLLTGSLGILSEAAHSLLDLGAALITWFAVRVADQPADERHPYGHAKVESVSALIETGLLFLTSGLIIKEAAERLFSADSHVETTWYSVAVIVVSMAIDFGRSRALMKVAKATGSQALEADALHFSSDILSSGVVLLGLGLVWAGWPKGDAVAAMGVSVFVAMAGWNLGKRTIDALMDAAPEGVAEQVAEIAASVPEVAKVGRVRARPMGPSVLAELTVKVARTLPFERVETVRDAVAAAIRAKLPEVEPLVLAEPLALDDESVIETLRVLAAVRKLAIHHEGVNMVDGHPHLSFDLEVEEGLSIRAAHDVVSELEAAIRAELGNDVTIDSHIDPKRPAQFSGGAVTAELEATVRKAVEVSAGLLPLVERAHNFSVQSREDGLYVSFHCLFPDDASVKLVHDTTKKLEYLLRDRIDGLARVVIHAEPLSHPEKSGAEAAQ